MKNKHFIYYLFLFAVLGGLLGYQKPVSDENADVFIVRHFTNTNRKLSSNPTTDPIQVIKNFSDSIEKNDQITKIKKHCDNQSNNNTDILICEWEQFVSKDFQIQELYLKTLPYISSNNNTSYLIMIFLVTELSNTSRVQLKEDLLQFNAKSKMILVESPLLSLEEIEKILFRFSNNVSLKNEFKVLVRFSENLTNLDADKTIESSKILENIRSIQDKYLN